MNKTSKIIILFYCLLMLAVHLSINLLTNEKAKHKLTNEPHPTKDINRVYANI